MTKKRFTVEKMDLVSDHLSTRFYIKDNLDEEYYDVQHMISEGFEVQYDTWATNIANKMNELSEENEELKNEVQEQESRKYACIETANSLKIENEELKQRIKTLKDTIDGLTGTIAHFDIEEQMGDVE